MIFNTNTGWIMQEATHFIVKENNELLIRRIEWLNQSNKKYGFITQKTKFKLKKYL